MSYTCNKNKDELDKLLEKFHWAYSDIDRSWQHIETKEQSERLQQVEQSLFEIKKQIIKLCKEKL